MDIKLTPEQDQLVERLVSEGRFASPEDVVDASLALIQSQNEWRQYAQRRIDAGVEAFQFSDFAPEEEIDSLFAKYQRKSA